VVLDVGPSMRASGALATAVESVRQFMLQKMLLAPKDDIAIVLYGTEGARRLKRGRRGAAGCGARRGADLTTHPSLTSNFPSLPVQRRRTP
jgi:hypothetical protein